MSKLYVLKWGDGYLAGRSRQTYRFVAGLNNARVFNRQADARNAARALWGFRHLGGKPEVVPVKLALAD